MLPELGLYPGQKLLRLIDERDGPVMVQGGAVDQKVSVDARYVNPIQIKAYNSSDTSAPAKAKSHNCVSQLLGSVNPGLRPHPVKYSTQFGPPSAVPVKFWTIRSDQSSEGVTANWPGK